MCSSEIKIDISNALTLPSRQELFSMSSAPSKDNAYVWLLMKGSSYLPGVFTSVYSVKRTNPKTDLVVMETSDVSEESRNLLLKVATHICEVPYIKVTSKPLKTARQREMYSHWIDCAYTKINLLALPYKKVLFMDADTIHTDSTEDLFSLNAPAAPYANPFVRPLGKLYDHYKGPRGKDGYPLHAANISHILVSNILLKGGVLPISSSMLLEPSIQDYNDYINMLKGFKIFGFDKCINGYDEQSICYFYSTLKKKSWTAVHQRYNYIAWKDGFLEKRDFPKVLHYMSDTKPWHMKYNEYSDVITWNKMAYEAIENTNVNFSDLQLKEENVLLASSETDTFIKKFIDVDSVLDILLKNTNKE